MTESEWLDDWSDELDDREYPDEDDFDDDSIDLISCPECGTDVYEQAEQCPQCGFFIPAEARNRYQLDAWWFRVGKALVVLLLLTIFVSLLLFIFQLFQSA